MAPRRHKPIAVYGALTANLAIAVAKFIAAAVTGSSVMVSEAIHSVADSGNELLLLLGLRRSRKPPDERHPYGHGKEVYFWSLIVAIVLFALGGGMSLYEGIVHLIEPRPVQDPIWSFVVLGIAATFELSALIVAIRELRKKGGQGSLWQLVRRSKDPSVFTVVGEDVAALLGIAIAATALIASLLTGRPEFDGVGSLGVGTLLCAVAVVLARECHALLIGESGSDALVESLRQQACADPNVCQIGYPMTMQLGPDEVLVNLKLEFRDDLEMPELLAAVERLERELRRAHPEVKHIFLESTSFRRVPSSAASSS